MIQPIDTQKIGLFIKKALKERHLTQDDLAKHLHISKSAVSQNLNGKSSFDLENLIKIAELLNITLDEMIHQKIQVEPHISEYERMVKKGQSEIENIHPDKLNITRPDIYGYLLVDYIIKYDRADMMSYLLKHGIALFEKQETDSILYYGKILNYIAKKNLPYLENMVRTFIKEYGSLKALQETDIESLLKSLNHTSKKAIIQNLLSMKIERPTKKLRMIKTESKVPAASHQAWITWISKYHLHVFLDIFIKDYADYYDYEPLIDGLTKYDYLEGLELYFNYLDKKHYMKLEAKLYKFQEALNILIERNYPSYAYKAFNLGLISDYNTGILKAMDHQLEDLAIQMMEKDKPSLKFRVLLKKALDKNMKRCLETYLDYASNDDLNYLLSEVTQDKIEFALLLMDRGALFHPSFIKNETLLLINQLIFYLRKES